jgi:hypothetical protein
MSPESLPHPPKATVTEQARFRHGPFFQFSAWRKAAKINQKLAQAHD